MESVMIIGDKNIRDTVIFKTPSNLSLFNIMLSVMVQGFCKAHAWWMFPVVLTTALLSFKAAVSLLIVTAIFLGVLAVIQTKIVNRR
tara:strand:- start:1176 stop:1436 length:261 start_codon:yes stop_codon:yes gene_type:complete